MNKNNESSEAFIIGLKLTALVMFCLIITEAQKLTPSSIPQAPVQTLSSSAVLPLVVNIDSKATGFYLRTGNRVVTITNRHVCAPSPNFNTPKNRLVGQKIKVGADESTVIGVSDAYDLCMLSSNSPVGLSLSSDINRGEMESTYSVGYVDGVMKVKRRANYVREESINWYPYSKTMRTDVYDRKIDYGESGSPVLNSRNQVVGVMFAKREENDMAFMARAIPLASLRKFVVETLQLSR